MSTYIETDFQFDGHNEQDGNFILTVRPMHLSEAKKFQIIYNDSKNWPFDTPPKETSEGQLKTSLETANRKGNLFLFVIRWTKHDYMLPLGTGQGSIVGWIEIVGKQGECNVGGIIHHPEVGKGYGKAAFGATFDYVLKSVLAEDVLGLGQHELVVETKRVNEPFRNLMKSLGLKDLEVPGHSEENGEDIITYKLSAERWEQAKTNFRPVWKVRDRADMVECG